MSIRPRCVLERTKHPLDDVSLDRCVLYDPALPGGGGGGGIEVIFWDR
jgi:hypothetical protein